MKGNILITSIVSEKQSGWSRSMPKGYIIKRSHFINLSKLDCGEKIKITGHFQCNI